MQKQIAEKLAEAIKRAEVFFSSPERAKNPNHETFKAKDLKPLSDFTAAIVFEKNTGKQAVAFFYYVDSNGGYWQYFFPKDSHILGMDMFGRIKQEIEEFNYPKNFEVKK